VIATIAYCPLCGKAVCPACGTHDVVQISRVTGYLQAVEGFNAAKKQELKDRTRYSTDGAVASIGISMS
jgi:anaerobic ribonucleoside-triphosphate reductase